MQNDAVYMVQVSRGPTRGRYRARVTARTLATARRYFAETQLGRKFQAHKARLIRLDTMEVLATK